MKPNPSLSAAAFAALACLSAPAARAETTLCTPITSLPAVVSTQGVYCLTQDLATAIGTGAAITINTNNVTLDCNERKLGGLAAGAGTQAIGIYAGDRSNITIRGCSIRGFNRGISLGDSGATGGGHLVEGNRLDGNTYIGIQVGGDGSRVRDNLVTDTGGSTLGFGWTMGVNAYGNVEVTDNVIQGMFPATSREDAYGVMVTGSQNGSVAGNRITASSAPYAIGVRVYASTRVRLVDNYVSDGGWTLYCDETTGGWTQGNQMHTAGIYQCANASDNLVLP